MERRETTISKKIIELFLYLVMLIIVINVFITTYIIWTMRNSIKEVIFCLILGELLLPLGILITFYIFYIYLKKTRTWLDKKAIINTIKTYMKDTYSADPIAIIPIEFWFMAFISLIIIEILLIMICLL